MLIDNNILPSYELPHVTRKRVLLSDVLELLKTKESEDKNPENKKKKGRGGPENSFETRSTNESLWKLNYLIWESKV